jgi:hypothetical protein
MFQSAPGKRASDIRARRTLGKRAVPARQKLSVSLPIRVAQLELDDAVVVASILSSATGVRLKAEIKPLPGPGSRFIGIISRA